MDLGDTRSLGKYNQTTLYKIVKELMKLLCVGGGIKRKSVEVSSFQQIKLKYSDQVPLPTEQSRLPHFVLFLSLLILASKDLYRESDDILPL